MKSNNICKFTLAKDIQGLKTDRFIFETNPEVMKKQRNLSKNSIILITGGSGRFKLSNKDFSFKKGDLIFCFKGEVFSGAPENKCQYMYIDFDGTRSEEFFRRFDINPNNRLFEGFDSIIPLWRESLTTANEMTIDLASESILLYTFSRLFKNTNKNDNLINKLIELSENEFSNPDLSVNSVADTLGYNPKYISHIFKEKMNITFSEYLRNLRIKYAISLFDHGIDSVKNVALLSGFTDPLYFSTVFKKSLGISPREYKAKKE